MLTAVQYLLDFPFFVSINEDGLEEGFKCLPEIGFLVIKVK